MAKGQDIVVSANPQGRFIEGIVGDTSAPGTIMQISATVAPVEGRHTWIAAATGTDGKEVLKVVLLPDRLQGRLATDAYVANTRGFLYCWLPGDEVNFLAGEGAGSSNTFNIGDRFIVDAENGILVPDTGSPQECVAIAMEKLTQQVGSVLVWCMAT